MQFFTLAAVFFSLAAMPQLLVANPLEARGGEGGGGGGGGNPPPPPPPPPTCDLCPGTLYSLPKCCTTNIGGIVATDCINPNPNPPTNDTSFRSGCATVGRAPACCTVGVLGLGVLCDARA
ncbi:fungal hydrophobin-domain-containing protein [Mycena albidolilacea]|uniref:Fungal hydrophobin-domain-containing protein n=1 Tax=Mycena albidolilacea TaxID=1033008 RepID=A0AAD7EBP5_9AGAR|nr:fungal hydrophobin-domain-containing protein [Mycena albidolilacea]KAJ7308623.1 fungal hydrophobin-domain-containing protein [Mycena albidolilacea]